MIYNILVPEAVLLFQNIIVLIGFSSNGYARRFGILYALNVIIGIILHNLPVVHTFAFHNLNYTPLEVMSEITLQLVIFADLLLESVLRIEHN
jgi:hypothetical protein